MYKSQRFYKEDELVSFLNKRFNEIEVVSIIESKGEQILTLLLIYKEL